MAGRVDACEAMEVVRAVTVAKAISKMTSSAEGTLVARRRPRHLIFGRIEASTIVKSVEELA
jgi:hypothetical protein